MHVLVPIETLKPHERIEEQRLAQILSEIGTKGIIPIIIDAQTRTILDGHHRFAAMRSLGYRSIPAFALDYGDESITIDSWRKDALVSKELVLRCASCGELLEPKTTRHTFSCPSCEPIPLSQLE